MKKETLKRFIDKYSLGGSVNSAVWIIKDNVLSTRFITSDKSLLGELSLKEFEYEDSKVGIYDTTTLTKMLSVLSNDVKFSVKTAGDKSVSLDLSDNLVNVNYMLSDLSVISEAPQLKTIPDMNVKIKVDTKFINTFIRGKNALSDIDTFTVIANDKKTEIVIGYSTINSNRISIPVETELAEDIKNISFNANLFKEMLIANKECNSAVFEVSEGGLSRITFKSDNYDVTYYLVAIQE